jgi:hypothetical protein
MSINFVPTSLTESFEVMNHIQDDLIARGMQFDGDLDELRLLLIERLQMEHDLNSLQDAITQSGFHLSMVYNTSPGTLIKTITHANPPFGLSLRANHILLNNAAASQVIIGWHNLRKGRISKEWSKLWSKQWVCS